MSSRIQLLKLSPYNHFSGEDILYQTPVHGNDIFLCFNHLSDHACENSFRLNLILRQYITITPNELLYNLICTDEKIRGIPQGDGIGFGDINPLNHLVLWFISQSQPTQSTVNATGSTWQQHVTYWFLNLPVSAFRCIKTQKNSTDLPTHNCLIIECWIINMIFCTEIMLHCLVHFIFSLPLQFLNLCGNINIRSENE